MKNVYILGAGCSCEDGTPLVNDFFPRIEELLKTELKDHQEITNFKQIVELKKKLFNDFNIEEFFSIIDFYISMAIDFQPYNLKSIREGLIYLISRTIKHSLADVTKSSNYKEFYTKLITGDDIIISLNWDLLLDNIRDGVNYGVGFLRYDIEDRNHNRILVADVNEKIKILKLHGSLNFLGCTKCPARFFSYKSKALVVVDEKRKCPNCKEGDLRILLIPPTTFKNLNNFEQLKEIWGEAFNKLVYCDKIRFVGYSLPIADVDFKYLLKAALNYRENPPIIEVYDYKKKNKDRKEFENHYNQIFDEITNLEKPIRFHYTKFSKIVNYLQQERYT